MDVRVRLKTNQYAMLIVIDQGSGITRKYLGSVFNKFVQVELRRGAGYCSTLYTSHRRAKGIAPAMIDAKKRPVSLHVSCGAPIWSR